MPQPFLALRGSPLRVRASVKALVAAGCSVDLLVMPFGADDRIPGVEIHRAGRLPGIKSLPVGPSWQKLVYDVALFCSAFKLALKKQYSVIHGVEEAGVMAALLGLVLRRPYVFDMHSCMSEQLRDRRFFGAGACAALLARVEALCIKGAAGVMTVSDSLTERAKNVSGSRPCITVQDIAASPEVEVDQELLQKLRSSCRTAGRRVIVYTGNFDPCQGLDLLLPAFAELSSGCKKDSDKPLLIIAGGGEGEEVHRRYYEDLAQTLGITQDVLFLGSRPVEEMPTVMELADALVSPRISGTNTPLKIYCYMASGKPIVATDILSHTHVLNSDCAFLSPPNPSNLAAALREAIDDRPAALEKSRRLAAEARRMTETTHSPRQFEKKLALLYSYLPPTAAVVQELPQEKELDEIVKEVKA